MIKTDLNIKETNGPSKQEVISVLQEGYEISAELRDKLSKISINIDGNKNPEIINAIRRIFGDDYISRTGNSKITYEMYCSTLSLIRSLGENKSQEVL